MDANKVTSLYIHFPHCRHLCNYCDFFKSTEFDREGYHQQLEESWGKLEKLLGENKMSFGPLKSIFIGGGTPSLWGSDGARFLNDLFARKGVELDPDIEFTMEVNPGSWTEESLDSWNQVGVNRYSLGIQSTNQDFLKVLDRVHNRDDVFTTLEKFNKEGWNFSVDFMLGLPFSQENGREIIDEIDLILKYNPKHLSAYILTVKGNYVHKAGLPSDEYIEQEYLRLANRLQQDGFHHYEVSNFALENFQSQHNLKYWKCESVAALGPSATGFLNPSRTRFRWNGTQSDFEIEQLSADQFRLEELYLHMRINTGIDSSFFGASHTSAKSLFNNWKERDLGSFNGDRFALNSMGYLNLDSLIGEIFSAKLLDFA